MSHNDFQNSYKKKEYAEEVTMNNKMSTVINTK